MLRLYKKSVSRVEIKCTILACVLMSFLLEVLWADSIIDFGRNENKPYKPYQSQAASRATMQQTNSIAYDIALSENSENETKNTESTIIAAQESRTKITPTITADKPVHAGVHLKGREFFNYYIKDKPKGIVRDFYIWQYLNENTLNAKEINEAYRLLNAKNPYLRRVLDKLGKTEKVTRDIECAKMAIKTALKQNNACLAISVRNRLSAFKTLPKQEVNAVVERLATSHKDTVQAIKILNSKNRTRELFKANSIVFTMVYHALNTEEKHKMTTDTPAKDLQKLSEYKTNGFYSILNSIILDSKLHNLKTMLLKSDITQAPYNTLFLLGINELRFGSKDKAMSYFKRSQDKATLAFFIDRALFWQYLVSKDNKYLEQLLTSKNANIFSIYASQKLKKDPRFVIVNTLPSLALSNPPFDIRDPYIWQNISSTMINGSDPVKLAKVIPYFSYKDTMPQLAYLMQKIDKYSTNYYITPYEGLIQWKNTEEQSFVFAIARQESHFIPTLISRSFALGIMQIMPANVKPFAKEMGIKEIEYHDLFDPKMALEMGRHFIRQLQKEYKNPLFVAYAYNGGPGFLRRLLAKNELFLKNRSYEPWLSMELIPYEESRFYGMKVLANFIIYEKLLGKNIDLQSLLDKTLIYHNPNITK